MQCTETNVCKVMFLGIEFKSKCVTLKLVQFHHIIGLYSCPLVLY